VNPEQLFAQTLLQGAHSLEALRAEFGAGPGEDEEINLAAVDPATFDELRGSKVMPIPGVKLYLESGDDLTGQTCDLMEQAMETAYQVKPPFFITSMRGTKNGKITVDYFYLDKE
jgi:hypothetical protein